MSSFVPALPPSESKLLSVLLSTFKLTSLVSRLLIKAIVIITTTIANKAQTINIGFL